MKKKGIYIFFSIIVLSLLFVSCELFEDDEKTVNSGSGLQLAKEVASYNGTSYASVQEAVYAALKDQLKDQKTEGDEITIKLLCDVRGGGFTVSSPYVELPEEGGSTTKGTAEPKPSYAITLDFQGHTYEFASETGIKMLSIPHDSNRYPCIYVRNATVNVKNAKLKRGDGANGPLFICSDSEITIDKESQLNAGSDRLAMTMIIEDSNCRVETADITGIVSIDTVTDTDTEHTISFNKDTDFKNKVTLFGNKLCIKSEDGCLKVEKLDDEKYSDLITTITFEVKLKEENKEENIVDVDEFRKKYYTQDAEEDSIQTLIKCLNFYELYFYDNEGSYQIKSQNDLIPYIEKNVFTKINKDPSILDDKLNSELCILPLHAIGTSDGTKGIDIPICVRFEKVNEFKK